MEPAALCDLTAWPRPGLSRQDQGSPTMADSGASALEIGEADANWALIKDKVVEARFGPAAVPVPFLEDAAAYELLSVLVRKPGRAQRLLGRARPLVPVGALVQLAQQGLEPGALGRCTREYRARGEAHYEETRLVAGAPCHIQLQLASVHKKVAFLALRPGQLALRPDLPWLRGLRSLYLLHEVFYCGGLALAVTRGQCQRTLRLPGPRPLAFCCLKFALGPRGLLGPQKPLGPARPARAAWLKLPAPEPPAKSKSSPEGRSPLCRATRTGKWPFARRRAQPAAPRRGDPDRHAMSLPLLPSAESDSDG
ncbi:amidohydrolase [Platysternon megacephalum]|uniref:Amidohydrolase n=1 Tax=Platysternon megacephalum TaxID=55544 RepID=A0A4D9DLZ8_9SAUR|nr:amidohydrolase [Platysternon megacephalum]